MMLEIPEYKQKYEELMDAMGVEVESGSVG